MRFSKKLLFSKTYLSHRHMEVSRLVNPEFHPAGLHFLYGFGYIESHGPTLGFGIRPRGPRILPKFTHRAHHIGRGDGLIEIDPSFLDLFDQVFGADRNPHRPPGPLFPFRLSRRPEPGPSCPGRWEAPPSLVPSGPHAAGRRPACSASSTVSSNFAKHIWGRNSNASSIHTVFPYPLLSRFDIFLCFCHVYSLLI